MNSASPLCTTVKKLTAPDIITECCERPLALLEKNSLDHGVIAVAHAKVRP